MSSILRAYRRFIHRKERAILCQAAVMAIGAGQMKIGNDLIRKRRELEYGKKP